MVDLPRMPNDWIQQLRGIFFAKDRSPIISAFNWLGLPLITTPSVNPSVDNHYTYFKSDGELYSLNWNGTESLISSQIQLIEEIELTADVAEINFTGIPQTFRSLLLFIQARSDNATERDFIMLRINNDSSNNYDYILTQSNNGAIAISTSLAQTSIRCGLMEADNSRANNFSPAGVHLIGYSEITKEKLVYSPLSASFGDVSGVADVYSESNFGRRRNIEIITTVTVYPLLGTNLVSGCIAQLYGIL